MKNRLLALAICIALLLGCASVLTACDTHTHEYASTYSSDENDHWFACSCGAKKDAEPHKFDDGVMSETDPDVSEYTCSVCGYKTTQKNTRETVELPNAANLLASANLTEAGRGYIITVKDAKANIGGAVYTYVVGLEDGESDMPTQIYSDEKKGNVEGTLNAELYIGKDSAGLTEINGHAEISVKLLSEDGKTVISTANFAGTVAVRGENVMLHYKSEIRYPGLPEGIRELNESSSDEKLAATLKDLIGMIIGAVPSKPVPSEPDDNTNNTDDIILPEETIDGDGDNGEFVPGDNEPAMPSYSAMINEILGILQDFAIEKILPLLSALPSDPNAEAEANKQLSALLNTLFAVKATDDGYTLSSDFSQYKKLNMYLYTKKIPELTDILLGEGTYRTVKSQLLAALNMKVGALVDGFEASGITVEDIEDLVNRILSVVYPDGNTTVETFLGQSLTDLLCSDAAREQTVGDFISAMSNGQFNTATLSAMFTMMENITVYDLLNDATDPDSVKNKEEMKNRINGMFDLLSALIQSEIKTDKDCNIKEASLTLHLTTDIYKMLKSFFPDDQPTIDGDLVIDDGVSADVTAESFETIEVKLTVNCKIGAFRSTMNIDYAAFIASFTPAVDGE